MNGIIVKLENVNGKQVPAVTSQQLAEVFGKEHYNVLRDIRETVAKCSKSFCALNFEGAEYDGTPIRQLKWDTGVIPVIQNFLDAEIED